MGTPDDSEVVDTATQMIRFGAAALVQIAPEESHFLLYGPGFAVRVERTDPADPCPGCQEPD